MDKRSRGVRLGHRDIGLLTNILLEWQYYEKVFSLNQISWRINGIKVVLIIFYIARNVQNNSISSYSYFMCTINIIKIFKRLTV